MNWLGKRADRATTAQFSMRPHDKARKPVEARFKYPPGEFVGHGFDVCRQACRPLYFLDFQIKHRKERSAFFNISRHDLIRRFVEKKQCTMCTRRVSRRLSPQSRSQGLFV